jgi:hypothetical protein
VAEGIQHPRDDERDDRWQAEAEASNRERNDQIVDADGPKHCPYDDRGAGDEKCGPDPRQPARYLRQRAVVLDPRFDGRGRH